MKTILLEMLEMSSSKYEETVIDHYLLWCNLNSAEDVDCQKLLANSALFNWWCSQYQQLENKFVQRYYEFYGKADKGIMRERYTETMISLRGFYSKPLMKRALRHAPITPQLN